MESPPDSKKFGITGEADASDAGVVELDRQQWLQSIFERLQGPLVAYANRLLGGDLAAAQDCVQEVFLSLCREPRDRVESHVDAWLYKSCRNRAMDIYRREARMIVNSEAAALAALPANDVDPSDRMIHAEQKNEIERQIFSLPRLEQEVVMLRLGQGLSYKQIAEVTELSVSHVGVLLHQAMSKLRRSLKATESIQPA